MAVSFNHGLSSMKNGNGQGSLAREERLQIMLSPEELSQPKMVERAGMFGSSQIFLSEAPSAMRSQINSAISRL